MSFKSGGASRSLGHALSSRSLPPVHDGGPSVVVDDAQRSCWASMPLELLRDVLTRVEVEESSWPARKYVVACAGVCNSWRGVVKEIVMTPEVSGRLTLPFSVKQGVLKNYVLTYVTFLVGGLICCSWKAFILHLKLSN